MGELGRSGSRMKRVRNSCCSCCRSGLVWHGHRRGKTKAPDKALGPIMRTSEAIKGVGSWWVSSGYPQEGSIWAYRTRCSNKCFVVQKSQEGWGVGENSLTNSKVRASCWRRDLRAWWGTELDPGKASLFVVAEQGIGPQVMSQFQVGQMVAAMAGSRVKIGRLQAADGDFGMFRLCWCSELESKGN